MYVRSLQVRTYNLREVKPLRNLDPQHIDQMVALRGMVIRTSQIIPDLKQAFFRCIVCNASKEVGAGTTRISPVIGLFPRSYDSRTGGGAFARMWIVGPLGEAGRDSRGGRGQRVTRWGAVTASTLSPLLLLLLLILMLLMLLINDGAPSRNLL